MLSKSILSIATALFVSSLNAAPLVRYDFTGSTYSPSLEAPGVVTASAMTQGGGLARFVFDTTRLDDVPEPWGGAALSMRVKTTTNSYEEAIETDSYFSFTITPESTISLGKLSFDAASFDERAIYGLIIRSNVTGNNDLFNFSINDPIDDPRHISVNIGSYAQFHNLTNDVTLKFYLYGTEKRSAYNFMIDNITIESYQSIPEPSSLVFLLGAGALSLGVAAKRRSKAKGRPFAG